MTAKETDVRIEVIATELKRLGEAQQRDAERWRDWMSRLDAEIERLWNELGLRRAQRR